MTDDLTIVDLVSMAFAVLWFVFDLFGRDVLELFLLL